MSEFFSHIIDRHLGSPNVVVPRTRSRFESVGVAFEKSWSRDCPQTGDPGGGNLESQDGAARFQANYPHVPPVNRVDPPRADPEATSPLHPVAPVRSMNDGIGRRNTLARSPASESIPAGADSLHLFTRRNATLETRRRPTQSEDVHETRSGIPPTEETRAHTKETGLVFDRQLENRIRTMLVRLTGHRESRPAELDAVNRLDRSIVSEPVTSADTDPGRTIPPQLSAPALNRSPKRIRSDADQERPYAPASENQDIYQDGILAPPSWLSDLKVEFNQPGNECNQKSEPEPVVNVTIGRVEVRAVQAEPPQKTRHHRKPPGVMSLDQYLAQRERRGAS